jgi:hypothetical protein
MASAQSVSIGLIVEGQGEELAVPFLIRRIAQARGFYIQIKCQVWRVPKTQLPRGGQRMGQAPELKRAVEGLTRQIGRNRPIMILLDADEDCPQDLATNLKSRCLAEHADVKVSIVIAKKEYEAWFLAAANSLAGQRGLATSLTPPSDPESIRGAKEWLTEHMSSDQSYSPTRHQSVYSELMDLSEARTARSFRKFETEVASLLGLGPG